LLHACDLGTTPLSPSLIDQLAADIHTSIIEVERRVLPLLESALADDPDEAAVAAAGIDELIEEP
jgi:hypothetical protein